MQAAIYARVSTGRQAAQDLCIPDQIAQCEAYCAKREWQVASTFIDAGASATTDNRPEFQAMIAEACSRPKPFDVVLVHSQSRFARNTLDLLHYTKKLEKAEVQFVSITQDIGTGEQADVLRTILGAMDEYQSKETSKHVSRSMCENARQGFWNGAQPPFGYRTYVAEKRGKKDKKKLEINPAEAEVVRRIFTLYVHGEGKNGPLGIKAIANLLNTEGVRTRRGSKFLVQYIHDILTNEAYITRHVFNRRDSKTRKIKPEDQWIAFETPRIIEDVIFNAVRDRLEHNHPLRTSPRVVKSDILLTGLAHCAHCGSRLRIQTGKSGAYRYYKCGKRSDAGKSVCEGCSISMDKLDELVLETLLDRTLAPERLDQLLTPLVERAGHHQRERQNRLKGLKKDRGEIKTQLDNLWHQIGTEVLRLDASLKAHIEKLQNKYEDLVRAISRLEQQDHAPLKPFSSTERSAFADALRTRLMSNEDPKFRRAYARALITRVDVGKKDIRICGANAALAALATNFTQTNRLVPTFAQEWRTRHDSNVRPLPSEGNMKFVSNEQEISWSAS